MLNQLQSCIVWSQRSNSFSVHTDCPQRDERCGWTGDINLFMETEIFNHDVASFYTKIVRDIAQGQTEAGGFQDLAPFVEPDWKFAQTVPFIKAVVDKARAANPGQFGADFEFGWGDWKETAPGWGDAGVLMPWMMYATTETRGSSISTSMRSNAGSSTFAQPIPT